MSLCRGCGSQIEWIKTTAGRNMPVDPEPVFVIEGDGRDRFVTHWKTCPNAGDFRRRGRG